MKRFVVAMMFAAIFTIFPLTGNTTETKRAKTAKSTKAVAIELSKALLADGFIEKDCYNSIVDKASIINVKTVDLDGDKKPEYIVEGNPPCAFGASRNMYWVYKKTDQGYHVLLDAGAADGIQALKNSTNGYRDLIILPRSDSVIYKYDGNSYKRAK